jgi:hypothetical protein
VRTTRNAIATTAASGPRGIRAAYRNAVGHQVHNLLLDVSPEPIARDMMITYLPDSLPKYDYKAAARLRHFLDLFDGLYRTHHYVMELNFDRVLFGAAENTFLAEIKRLDRKIQRLAKIRQGPLLARAPAPAESPLQAGRFRS